MTSEEKHKQILKEIKWTLVLFFTIAAWHVITGFALNGNGKFLLGMPMWFTVSVFGSSIIAIVGIIILTKKVFVDFEYDEETEVDKV